MAARNPGIQDVWLSGVEVLSSAKFAIITDILRERIRTELQHYTLEEQALSADLLALADNLQILFQSQDTPLYYTQNEQSVHDMAEALVRNVQKPLTLEELPEEERRMYIEFRAEAQAANDEMVALRQQYMVGEMFTQSVDFTGRIGLTCLLGISPNVRQSLERLAMFNRQVTERFNLMTTNVGADNLFMVQYVLEYVKTLQLQHQTWFPSRAKRRKGNYAAVYTVKRVVDNDDNDGDANVNAKDAGRKGDNDNGNKKDKSDNDSGNKKDKNDNGSKKDKTYNELTTVGSKRTTAKRTTIKDDEY